MSSITNGSDGDGDTETSPDVGPKTNHNLSIVYIDHNLDKPTAEPTNDETGKSTDRPSLAVVYIDHHLDDSAPSDTSQGSDGSNLPGTQGAVVQNQQGLFRLPPELRTIVWELLLPGRRLLGAQAWSGTHRKIALSCRSRRNKECKWFFRVYDWDCRKYWGHAPLSLELPSLLQICAESRSVALQHGQFIFGREDDHGDTGTWWNSKLDVLVFDASWNKQYHPWALADLHGLEHVKLLAIDEDQAADFGYIAKYNEVPHPGDCYFLDEAVAFSFIFEETTRTQHYILEFFWDFNRLTIVFSQICEQLSRRSEDGGWVAPDFDEYSATFCVNMSMRTAVKELRKYRHFCIMTEEPLPFTYQFAVAPPDWDRAKFTEGLYFAYDDDFDLDYIDEVTVLHPVNRIGELGIDFPI